MKKSNFVWTIFSIIAITACFVSLFFFRQLPGGELWKGYSVLYVENKIPDSLVLNAFSEYEVKEYTCLSNQFLPTDLKADSCEVSLLSLNQEAVDYLLKRNNYFFDKSQNYRLYYVPVFYKNRLLQVVKSLKTSEGPNSNYNSGVDTKSSYPFLIPIFTFLYGLILFIFSKKRKFFSFLAFLPVIYTVSFPFISSEISVCILLSYLFMFTNIFGRRDFQKILLKKYVYIILFIFSLVSVFTSGFFSGFVFLLVLLSEISILYLFRKIQITAYQKSHFNPVMIRSSRVIPLFLGKENIVFGLLLGLSALSFVFSILTSGPSVGENFGTKIYFPSVTSSSKNENLPDLKDYYKWDFAVRSFPYQSLNSLHYSSENTSISRFTKEGNEISQKKDIFQFSEQYEESVYNKIDLLPFNAFEKIMKKQGEDFRAGYSSNGSHHLSLFCIIISFMQFTLTLFYFAWMLINKGRRHK